MKIAAFILSLLFLFSCSGYFNDDQNKSGDPVQPLAISGGGYLSSDTANEITPFLYRDSVSGRSWLIYSSDKTGNYDIYYAEMNFDGKFSSPVKFPSGINTSYNEFSPVIYGGTFNATPGIFMSYIRVSNNQSNVYRCELSSNLSSFISEQSSFLTVTNAMGLSLFVKTNIDPILQVCLGYTNWFQYTWGGIDWNPVNVNTNTLMIALFSTSGLQITNSIKLYLYNVKNSGKYQIAGCSVVGSLTNYYSIPEYSSLYNDMNPDIDISTYKVYFTSDRRGTLDLYRYNINTFSKVSKVP